MGFMRNKAVAIVLPIIAVVLIFAVVKNYVMPQLVDLTVKCTDAKCENAKGLQNFKAAVEGPWPMACPACKEKTLQRSEIYNDGKKQFSLTDEEKVQWEKAGKIAYFGALSK